MTLSKPLHYITKLLLLSTILTVSAVNLMGAEDSDILKISTLCKNNKEAQALTILQKITSIPTPLKAPLAILQAELLIEQNQTSKAANILREFVDVRKLKESCQPKAAELLADLEYKKKNYKKAAELSSSLLAAFPLNRNRYALRYLLADSILKSEGKAASFDAFLSLAESKLQKEPARKAYDTLFKWFVNNHFPKNLSLEEKFRWARLLLRKREYTKVLDVVTPLINAMGKKDFSDSEKYEIFVLGGKTELARKNGWWAHHLFKKAVTVAPSNTEAAEAMILAGDSMYRLAHYVRSAKHYNKVVSTYPKLAQAAEATYKLANIYQKTKQSSKVLETYKDIVKKWPSSWFAKSVSWDLGLEEYRQKKFWSAALSLDHFIKMANGDRRLPAAAYFRAKALSHYAKPNQVQDALNKVLEYPVPGIYHLSAAYYIASGKKYPRGLPLVDFDKRKNYLKNLSSLVPTRPRDGWIKDFNIDFHEMKTVNLLREYGLFRLLSYELERLVSLHRGVALRNNLAWAYMKIDDYPGAIEQGEIILSSGPSEKDISKANLFDKLYPLPKKIPFDKYSKEFKVEPFITYSISREESHFDTGLISWAGAKGLMQVMNATGKWIAPKVGIRKFKPEMLYSPPVNIKMGCWYLDYLKKKYKDHKSSTLLAAGAYNGGPGNMGKWLRKNGGDFDCIAEFVETWPLSETRNYIRKVGRSIICFELLND